MSNEKTKQFWLIMDSDVLDAETDNWGDNELRYDTREEAIEAAKKRQQDHLDDGGEIKNDYKTYVLECTDIMSFPKPEIIAESLKETKTVDLRDNQIKGDYVAGDDDPVIVAAPKTNGTFDPAYDGTY